VKVALIPFPRLASPTRATDRPRPAEASERVLASGSLAPRVFVSGTQFPEEWDY